MEKYLSLLPIDIYVYLNNNINSVPEHKTQKATMNWLKENAKDLSFNAIKEEIVLESAIIPINLEFKARHYTVIYESGLVFTAINDNKAIAIDEEELYQTWDMIRKNRVFPEENDERKDLVYALLLKLGYLSSVFIVDNKTAELKAGYQVREGIGRAYSLAWSEK